MKTRKSYTNKQTPRIINQDKYNNNPNKIHEKKSDDFVKNYIKSKHNLEKYMKKNLSFSNLQNENIEEHTNKNISNINKNNNKNRCLSKHSSMKYFKITPIINPLYDRAYFTSKINLQTANSMNKKNIELDKIIKNVKLEEGSNPQQNQTLNKIQNIPIHIMNNINIINNNLVEENNLKNENLVFIKKRIQSCHKTSLSKPKEDKNNEIKLEEYCSVFNQKKDIEINYKNKENVYDNYKLKKYKQNLFNKTNIRKSKAYINNYNNKNINNNINVNKSNNKFNNLDIGDFEINNDSKNDEVKNEGEINEEIINYGVSGGIDDLSGKRKDKDKLISASISGIAKKQYEISESAGGFGGLFQMPGHGGNFKEDKEEFEFSKGKNNNNMNQNTQSQKISEEIESNSPFY